jgi:PKD repeat protein
MIGMIDMFLETGVATQFHWEPLSPIVGSGVTFTDDIGNIYKFDFGDGRFTLDKPPVTHIYTKPGEYSVTAVSKNTAGNTGVLTLNITVRGDVPPPPPEPGYLAKLIAAIVAFIKAIFGK